MDLYDPILGPDAGNTARVKALLAPPTTLGAFQTPAQAVMALRAHGLTKSLAKASRGATKGLSEGGTLPRGFIDPDGHVEDIGDREHWEVASGRFPQARGAPGFSTDTAWTSIFHMLREGYVRFAHQTPPAGSPTHRPEILVNADRDSPVGMANMRAYLDKYQGGSHYYLDLEDSKAERTTPIEAKTHTELFSKLDAHLAQPRMRPLTKSEAFDRWFAVSKVVDAEGKPQGALPRHAHAHDEAHAPPGPGWALRLQAGGQRHHPVRAQSVSGATHITHATGSFTTSALHGKKIPWSIAGRAGSLSQNDGKHITQVWGARRDARGPGTAEARTRWVPWLSIGPIDSTQRQAYDPSDAVVRRPGPSDRDSRNTAMV